MLSAVGGCEQFKELLPVLSSRHLFYKTHGHVYSLCVQNAMLHAGKTWPLTKPEDVATTRSNKLLAQLEIDDLDVILRKKRLRWFRHVERSSGAIKIACDIQMLDGKRRPGLPKMS